MAREARGDDGRFGFASAQEGVGPGKVRGYHAFTMGVVVYASQIGVPLYRNGMFDQANFSRDREPPEAAAKVHQLSVRGPSAKGTLLAREIVGRV